MADEKRSAGKYAWETFSKTGKIGYYLFYKALTYEEYDEREDEGNSTEED